MGFGGISIWQLMIFFVAVAAIIVIWKTISSAAKRRKRRKSESAPKPIEHSPKKAAQPATVGTNKTVFVSYRRDDSADVTGRIYDRLVAHFGAHSVFKDVDSIPLGRDFRKVIDNAVAKASVVVIVIGRDWFGQKDGSEKPRIYDWSDFVRTEVAAALEQDKPVIPVLVANAKMPSESELPDDIKSLAFRNGVNVRPDPDFVHDIERLIKGIEQA